MSANEYQVGGDHYRQPIQHWDYVLANDIPYLEAQVIKYLTRWRRKNGLEDLRKARHYLEKLIEWESAKAEEGRPNGSPDRASESLRDGERPAPNEGLPAGGDYGRAHPGGGS